MAFAGVLAFATIANARPAGPEVLWVLATGDLRGEIKPCGCSPGDELGGLARRLTYLEERRREYGQRVIAVDLGNNFPAPSAQGGLKVNLIIQTLRHARLDAVLPGPGELALGAAALDRSLPYLLSNADHTAPFAQIETVQRGGRRVGILGYLGPQQIYQGPQSTLKLAPADAPLLSRWRNLLLEHRVESSLLLFRGTDADLAAFVHSGMFDAIVVGNPSADESHQVTQRSIDNSTVPQVPTKGQGVLRWPLAGGPLNVDWLDGSYVDHSEVTSAMAAYDEQVKTLFLQQAAVAEAHRTASPYAGAQACKGCHTQAYAGWQRSRHAGALSTLQRVGKSFDPECLACHVTGLAKEGYVSQEVTPGLSGVQCENCHGAGKSHALAPGTVKPAPTVGASPSGRVTAATCSECHHGSHSPRFSFASYWSKIHH